MVHNKIWNGPIYSSPLRQPSKRTIRQFSNASSCIIDNLLSTSCSGLQFWNVSLVKLRIIGRNGDKWRGRVLSLIIVLSALIGLLRWISICVEMDNLFKSPSLPTATFNISIKSSELAIALLLWKKSPESLHLSKNFLLNVAVVCKWTFFYACSLVYINFESINRENDDAGIKRLLK